MAVPFRIAQISHLNDSDLFRYVQNEQSQLPSSIIVVLRERLVLEFNNIYFLIYGTLTLTFSLQISRSLSNIHYSLLVFRLVYIFWLVSFFCAWFNYNNYTIGISLSFWIQKKSWMRASSRRKIEIDLLLLLFEMVILFVLLLFVVFRCWKLLEEIKLFFFVIILLYIFVCVYLIWLDLSEGMMGEMRESYNYNDLKIIQIERTRKFRGN